ncbi:MAG: hypothetical protein LBK75_01010 [Oscillospiraceae bacterium]|nr:hypothetical protein [Oscillospiraceae bacterium]
MRRRIRRTGRREARVCAGTLLLYILLVMLAACAEIPASRTGASGDGQVSLPPETESSPSEDGRDERCQLPI